MRLRPVTLFRHVYRQAEAARNALRPMKTLRTVILIALLAVPAVAADELRPVREKLGPYRVDIRQTSVSGLSAGGFMAGQFLVAYSGILSGAGIFAGGPYGCARGDLAKATGDCMARPSLLTDGVMAHLWNKARTLAREGRIDTPDNLKSMKIFLFAGTNDKTVHPDVMERTYDWYRKAGVPESSLNYEKSLPAGHALPTLNYGNPCTTVSRPPWMNACNYDGAGKALTHIYGPLNPPEPVTGAGGKLIEFFQKDFVEPQPQTREDLAEQTGLNEFGYTFIPQSCRQGRRCRIHVVFHGCRQAYDAPSDGIAANSTFGLQMVLRAGYNEWAKTNSIIVVYPQAQKSKANPRGCFDWWGYLGGGEDTYLTKEAPQMKAVRAMIKTLSGK